MTFSTWRRHDDQQEHVPLAVSCGGFVVSRPVDSDLALMGSDPDCDYETDRDAAGFLSCIACSPSGTFPEMQDSITLPPSAFRSGLERRKGRSFLALPTFGRDSEPRQGMTHSMACKWYNLCPLRRLERKGLLDSSWANQYCRSVSTWRDCRRYQLEEQGIPHPDNMLPDGSTESRVEKE